jgi:hypothetical protein
MWGDFVGKFRKNKHIDWPVCLPKFPNLMDHSKEISGKHTAESEKAKNMKMKI